MRATGGARADRTGGKCDLAAACRLQVLVLPFSPSEDSWDSRSVDTSRPDRVRCRRSRRQAAVVPRSSRAITLREPRADDLVVVRETATRGRAPGSAWIVRQNGLELARFPREADALDLATEMAAADEVDVWLTGGERQPITLVEKHR